MTFQNPCSMKLLYYITCIVLKDLDFVVRICLRLRPIAMGEITSNEKRVE